MEPKVDVEGQAAWITEYAEIPYEIVRSILDVEMEHLIAVGIADLPEDYRHQYFDPSVTDRDGNYDAEVIIQRATEALDIDPSVARTVLRHGNEFLEMRGLTGS